MWFPAIKKLKKNKKEITVNVVNKPIANHINNKIDYRFNNFKKKKNREGKY